MKILDCQEVNYGQLVFFKYILSLQCSDVRTVQLTAQRLVTEMKQRVSSGTLTLTTHLNCINCYAQLLYLPSAQGSSKLENIFPTANDTTEQTVNTCKQ